jgi:putative intracellular protease/amidase
MMKHTIALTALLALTGNGHPLRGLEKQNPEALLTHQPTCNECISRHNNDSHLTALKEELEANGVHKARPLKLVTLVYPGYTTIDVMGPISMLSFSQPKTSPIHYTLIADCKLNQTVSLPNGRCLVPASNFAYDNASTGVAFGSATGQGALYVEAIDATAWLADADADLDIFHVPGGFGNRGNDMICATTTSCRPFLDLIRQVADRAKIIFAVCTGSALLAKAGLLNGRCATTNKAAFNWAMASSTADDFGAPTAVRWVHQARWVVDGKFVSSSGVSAGMDAAYFIHAKLRGVEAAEEAAKGIEYTPITNAASDPFAAQNPLSPSHTNEVCNFTQTKP